MLPDIVVKAESVNSFQGRLDKFWNDQEVKFNWKAKLKLKVLEVEVILYKCYFMTQNFYACSFSLYYTSRQ